LCTPFWDLIIEKHNKHHLPIQFNNEFYDFIQTFEKKRLINVPRHMIDIHVEGEYNYTPPTIGQDT
jgi:hypothetical protein